VVGVGESLTLGGCHDLGIYHEFHLVCCAYICVGHSVLPLELSVTHPLGGEMLGITFLFFMVTQIASAFYCQEVIEQKGYENKGSWFLGGLFFGLFALIAAAGMPDRKGNDS